MQDDPHIKKTFACSWIN
uniref:Uncharacterized protein n=1 Tax=Arundo donax TaxID=35708 RepID=A0A0A8Z4G3_ARUDO